MKKIIKFLIVFILLIIVINSSTPFVNFLLNRSIKNQITYLQQEFDNGLGEKLQSRYPEGQLFGNLLFALSLIKYSEINNNIDVNIIEKAILRTTNETAKNNFTKDLPLEYGAFYNGWINFTLKKYIKSNIFQRSSRKQIFKKLYNHISNKITEVQKDSVQLLDLFKFNMACR